MWEDGVDGAILVHVDGVHEALAHVLGRQQVVQRLPPEVVHRVHAAEGERAVAVDHVGDRSVVVVRSEVASLNRADKNMSPIEMGNVGMVVAELTGRIIK